MRHVHAGYTLKESSLLSRIPRQWLNGSQKGVEDRQWYQVCDDNRLHCRWWVNSLFHYPSTMLLTGRNPAGVVGGIVTKDK